MPAAKKNLIIEQGTDFSFTVTLKDPVTKLPIDLTGYSFAAQIREEYASAAPTASLVITNSAPTTGVITLSMTNANTSLLPAQKTLYYDLEGTNTSNQKFRILEGSVYISPEVTK